MLQNSFSFNSPSVVHGFIEWLCYEVFRLTSLSFNHRYLIEVDCSWGQFKLANLNDKKNTINAPIFIITLQKKKEMDAPNFQHLLLDVQLLIYVADAVSTSIRNLWFQLTKCGTWVHWVTLPWSFLTFHAPATCGRSSQIRQGISSPRN